MDTKPSTANQSNNNQERIVLTFSGDMLLFILIAAFIWFFWGLYEVIQDPSINMKTTEPPHHWLAVLVAGPATVLLFMKKMKGLPRVILDKNGIVKEQLFKRRVWRWEEIGPFSIDDTQFKHHHAKTALFSKNISYLNRHQAQYACAFTAKRRNKIFGKSGFRIAADYEKADIVIPLTYMCDGKDLDTPEELIKLLNDWRDRYGRTDPDQKTDELKTNKSPANAIWS